MRPLRNPPTPTLVPPARDAVPMTTPITPTASTHPHPATAFARGLVVLVLKAGAGVLVTASVVYLLGLLLLHGDTLGRWLPTARGSGLAQEEIDQLGQYLALDAPGGLPFATWLVGDDWWRGAGAAGARVGVLRGDFGMGRRNIPNRDWLWAMMLNLLLKAAVMVALLWPAALVAGRLAHAWCQRGPSALPRWLAALALSVPVGVLLIVLPLLLYATAPIWRGHFSSPLPYKIPVLDWYPSAEFTPMAVMQWVRTVLIPLLAVLSPWFVTWAMFAGRRFRAGHHRRRVGLAMGGLAIYQLPGLMAWAGAWGRDMPFGPGFRTWSFAGGLSLILVVLWVLVALLFLRGLYDLAVGRRLGDSAVLADVPADPLLANGVADLGSRGGTLGLRGALASSWMARIGLGLLVALLLFGLLTSPITGRNAWDALGVYLPFRKGDLAATAIILAASVSNSLVLAMGAAAAGVLLGAAAMLMAARLGRSEVRVAGSVGRAIGCFTAIPYLVLWVMPADFLSSVLGAWPLRFDHQMGGLQLPTIILLGVITAPVSMALTRRAVELPDTMVGGVSRLHLLPRLALAFTWSAAWAISAEVWAIRGPLFANDPYRSLGMSLTGMSRWAMTSPATLGLFLATIAACILPFVLIGLALRAAPPEPPDTSPAGRSPIPAYNSES